MWVYLVLDDVCSDMSRFHGIRDITKLSAKTFWRLAYRLPAYNGAVTGALERLRKEVQDAENEHLLDKMYTNDAARENRRQSSLDQPADPNRVLSLEELEALGPPAPELNEHVGIFEVARCT